MCFMWMQYLDVSHNFVVESFFCVHWSRYFYFSSSQFFFQHIRWPDEFISFSVILEVDERVCDTRFLHFQSPFLLHLSILSRVVKLQTLTFHYGILLSLLCIDSDQLNCLYLSSPSSFIFTMDEFIPWIWVPTELVICRNFFHHIVRFSWESFHFFISLSWVTLHLFVWPFECFHYVSSQVHRVVTWFHHLSFFPFLQLPFFLSVLFCFLCVHLFILFHSSQQVSETLRAWLLLQCCFPLLFFFFIHHFSLVHKVCHVSRDQCSSLAFIWYDSCFLIFFAFFWLSFHWSSSRKSSGSSLQARRQSHW